MSHRIAVGARVTVSNGEGTVRWTGTNPEFAAGAWVGVELFEPNGKNDGSVKGKSYFNCQPLYGVMVRPGSIKLADEGGASTSQTGSRPQSSASQRMERLSAGSSSPARRTSVTQNFSPSRPSPARAASFNPLQQRLNRAAGMPSSSISSRNLAGLASSGTPDKRGSAGPHAAVSGLVERSRSQPSPTPSPSSTPTPAPRPPITGRVVRPSSSLSQTTTSGLPAPEAISTGTRPSSRASSVASSRTRISRPSSVASDIDPASRAESRQSNFDHHTEGRTSVASVREIEEEVEELQATPKASLEPRKFGRGLAQGLAARAIQKPTAEESQSGGDNVSPADIFRAARDQRAGSTVPTVTEQMAHSGSSNALAEQAAARVHSRETEDLRIKVRVLEARRAEDAERIKNLEVKALQADGFAVIREKFIAKINDLKEKLRQTKQTEEQYKTELARYTEFDHQLEVLALDKEVAEMQAETLTAQVAQQQETLEAMKVEIHVLQDENAKYEAPAEIGKERSSAAFINLEKQMERVSAALLRSQENSDELDKAQKRRIAELEKDLSGSDELHNDVEVLNEQLQAAELQIEDLKQQLDGAMGAEDMLEQLTERTLNMGERIEEMRIHIEDLEAIKEMNEEIEEGHVEAEKELQETIDVLNLDLQEQHLQREELEALISDREGTILQFRDLVQGLQGELDALRAKHRVQEAETANLSSQSQAMLNMNLKLQSSVVKTQARALDLDLIKVEANVHKEHADIVQAYLPSTYFDVDFEATNAVLLLERLSGKADVLVSTFCQMHNLPDALVDVNNDRLPGICEVRGLITIFAIVVLRLARHLTRGPPQEFLAMSRLHGELNHIEEKLDQWFELIRRDEFSERDCSLELAGYVTELENALGSITTGVELDLAEKQLGHALAFDYELDNFAASVGLARYGILELIKDPDVIVEDSIQDLEQQIFEPVQRILNQVRSVKLNSMKLVECMRSLVNQSLSLAHDLQTPLRMISESVSRATDVAVQLAQKIGGHLDDLRGTQESLRLSVILQFLQEVTESVNPQGDIQPWDIIGMFVTRLGTDLNNLLPQVQTAIEDGQTLHTALIAPWTMRAELLRSKASSNAEAESELVLRNEQIISLTREVKLRDQTLEETSAKVEIINRRLETSKQNVDTIATLETELYDKKQQEKLVFDQLEKLRVELANLTAENARLHQTGLTSSSRGPANQAPQRATGSVDVDSSQPSIEVARLKTAIRMIRRENAYLKAEGLLGDFRSLPALVSVPSDLPPLEPSGPYGSSSSDTDDGPLTPSASRNSHGVEGKKQLWRELAYMQATASIVDLSKCSSRKGWQPRKNLPETQFYERERDRARLVRKIGAFLE